MHPPDIAEVELTVISRRRLRVTKLRACLARAEGWWTKAARQSEPSDELAPRSRTAATCSVTENVHLHALVLDGVFARAGDGQLRFHRAPPPSAADVAEVSAAIMPQVRARFAQAGVKDDDGAAVCAQADPGLAGLSAASVQGVLALAGVSGRRPQRMATGMEARGRTRSRRRSPIRPMPGGRASICTQTSPYLATVRDSSACVGTSCARR
jgi:hypothetical protein